MSNLPTPRPYTSYNLFFQLEREYILQTLLGFQPTIVSNDIFDPTDATLYPAEGPPLPLRYANLILPFDWHIPGKTRRRKRIHRKSHGKIGFHELNDRISKAWSVVEDEVKNYCVRLSDIESRKYKSIKRKTKKENRVAKERSECKTKMANKRNTSKSESHDDSCSDLFPSFDWTVNVPPRPFQDDNDLSHPSICCIISHGTLSDDISQTGSLHRESLSEVDMEDGEIIDIWNSTLIEDDYHVAIPSILSTCQLCVEIVNPADARTVIAKDNEEGKQDGTRITFIDAEYEMFKEIGKQFLIKQRLPDKLERKVFAACQA